MLSLPTDTPKIFVLSPESVQPYPPNQSRPTRCNLITIGYHGFVEFHRMRDFASLCLFLYGEIDSDFTISRSSGRAFGKIPPSQHDMCASTAAADGARSLDSSFAAGALLGDGDCEMLCFFSVMMTIVAIRRRRRRCCRLLVVIRRTGSHGYLLIYREDGLKCTDLICASFSLIPKF